MKKILASAAITATVIGGGLLAASTVASAQDDAPSWLDEALSPLVEDGTINEAQVDAVEAALRDARPMGPRHGHGHRGEVLETLGLDPELVREGLQAGQSLGEVAEANGISADAVVQAMIDEQGKHLAEAVEAGRIDADAAAERAAAFAERAQSIVDGTFEPGDGPGEGRRGHHRPFGGPGGKDAPVEDGAGA